MATRFGTFNDAVELPSFTRILPTRRFSVVALLLLFAMLLIDAMINARAFVDLSTMKNVQSIEFAGLESSLSAVSDLTSSTGAMIAWAVAMVFFLARRLWSVAVALVLMPAGGLLNEFIGTVLVDRTRPHLAELSRTSSNFEEHSFPSGHVMGAVLFYGLIFVVARRIEQRALRFAVQTLSLAVITAVGFARVWQGAHWPTDVIAAYALGGVLLFALATIVERLQETDGLPLFRAGNQAHDESQPHAHALTSLVLFSATTVSKVYNPGLLPRLLYFAAFQASFPYVANRHALQAALLRRNLASKLTEAWYGESRVASALAVSSYGSGYALVSDRINGSEPVDRDAAKSFLQDLAGRFDKYGLPTWQIDPRQPRAVDNVLETERGLVVVDLESGLVSPLASIRYWTHAIRHGAAPFFDDVQFARMRTAIEADRESLVASQGAEWLSELERLVDDAEASVQAWHASEPRLINRTFKFVLSGFGTITLYRKARKLWTGGNEKATQWMERAVDRWESEQRLTTAQVAVLRSEMQEPAFQELMPYMGGHILLSIPLRFPFGSIIRPLLVAGTLVLAFTRRIRGKIDSAAWQRARTIHSPAVIFVAAIPGLGSLAYVAAKPVRSNRLLLRVLGDAALMKVPFSLYLRSGTRRFVALPSQAETPAVTGPVDRFPCSVEQPLAA